MKSKVEFLKKKIEEMRQTKDPETNEMIGDIAKEHELGSWASCPAECLLNTVLAVRQKWKTVEPRLEAFKKNYPHIQTLYDLKQLIDSMNEKKFCSKVFGMNILRTHYWRYEMLKGMVDAFMRYQLEKGFSSDFEAMKNWAKQVDLYSRESDPVGSLKHMGVATIQNLRICLRIDTIKPDVHIKSALREIGLGNDVEVCELISELTNIPCIELDQIFWHWDRNRKAQN